MVWTLRRCICIVHANSYLRNTQSTSDVQRSPTVLGFGKNSTQPHLRLSCFQQTHCTWSGVTSINHLRILTRQESEDIWLCMPQATEKHVGSRHLASSGKPCGLAVIVVTCVAVKTLRRSTRSTFGKNLWLSERLNPPASKMAKIRWTPQTKPKPKQKSQVQTKKQSKAMELEAPDAFQSEEGPSPSTSPSN